MRLHDQQWGAGDKTALLLHGMMGSTESWWRVAPELAASGYRVIALDLPGHGRSPRDPALTVPDVAESVVSTLAALVEGPLELAIGHSFGGTVLAAAVTRLAPERVIYVDAPTAARGGWDRETVRAEYAADKRARTLEGLRRSRPYYSDRNCEVEAAAAELFDPDTAAGISASAGGDWMPSAPPRSLMLRASPSSYVTDDTVRTLRSRGVEVREIPGAAHSLWYSHFDSFMHEIDDWY